MQIAADIEEALYCLHCASTELPYRQHARMLKSNLASAANVNRRSSVLSGSLSPKELVLMSSLQLAPSPLQQQRRLAQQASMSGVMQVTASATLASNQEQEEEQVEGHAAWVALLEKRHRLDA